MRLQNSTTHPHATRLALMTAALAVVATPQHLLAQGKPRVAIVNFENNSTWGFWGDRLGFAAADEVASQLVASGAFSVIERAQLEAVLAEQRLGMSGAVTASTATRIGELLGVQFLVTGSITQFSVNTRSGGFGPLSASYTEAESVLDVRAINTTTGEVVLAVDGEGKKRLVGGRYKDKDFRQTYDEGLAAEALGPAVEQVVARLVEQSQALASAVAPPTAGTVVGERGGSFYIDRGENFGVELGQRFAVMRVVDEIKDSQGNVLDTIVEEVGLLEVVQVLSQSAVCTVLEGSAREGDSLEPR